MLQNIFLLILYYSKEKKIKAKAKEEQKEKLMQDDENFGDAAQKKARAKGKSAISKNPKSPPKEITPSHVSKYTANKNKTKDKSPLTPASPSEVRALFSHLPPLPYITHVCV